MRRFTSKLNQLLRSIGARFSTSNPVRTTASKLWTQLLSSTVGSIDVPMGNQTIRLLPKFRHISPDYEAETISVWGKLIEPSSVIWDVGANFGLYTLLSGKLTGDKGEIQSFEPSPDAYRVTKEHVRLNHLSSHCNVNQVAVSENDGGLLPFGIVAGEGLDPTNRLGCAVGKTISVPIVSLDGILSRASRAPNLIKVDIEGAEVLALRGASRLMEMQRPTILLAVHPMFLPEFECDIGEIESIVNNRGYECFNTSGKRVPPIKYSEYLLIPKEQVSPVCNRLGWTNQDSVDE